MTGICETCSSGAYNDPVYCGVPTDKCVTDTLGDPTYCAPSCDPDGGSPCPTGYSCVQSVEPVQYYDGVWSGFSVHVCYPAAGCAGVCNSLQAACSATSPCCTDLVCQSGTCLSPPGSSCTASEPGVLFPNPCTSGYACISGTCQTCIPNGGACSAAGECCGGLACNGTTCGQPTCGAYGQSCTPGGTSAGTCCGDGTLSCDANQGNICVVSNGASCIAGQKCVTGDQCTNGLCGSCAAYGAYCGGGATCCSGLTCDSLTNNCYLSYDEPCGAQQCAYPYSCSAGFCTQSCGMLGAGCAQAGEPACCPGLNCNGSACVTP